MEKKGYSEPTDPKWSEQWSLVRINVQETTLTGPITHTHSSALFLYSGNCEGLNVVVAISFGEEIQHAFCSHIIEWTHSQAFFREGSGNEITMVPRDKTG